MFLPFCWAAVHVPSKTAKRKAYSSKTQKSRTKGPGHTTRDRKTPYKAMYQEYNITIQDRYATRQSVKHHPQQHIASNFPQAQTPCAKRTCGKKTTKDNKRQRNTEGGQRAQQPQRNLATNKWRQQKQKAMQISKVHENIAENYEKTWASSHSRQRGFQECLSKGSAWPTLTDSERCKRVLHQSVPQDLTRVSFKTVI